LLGDAQEIIAFGDKGFICDPERNRLALQQDVVLITYRKSNQKQQNTPLEKWALGQYRQLIENRLCVIRWMSTQHKGKG
jgi:hypothetical protein